MEIYKKGQGTFVRWCAIAGIVAMVAYGCVTLYYVPMEKSWWRGLIVDSENPLEVSPLLVLFVLALVIGAAVSVRSLKKSHAVVRFGVTAVVAALLGIGAYLISRQPVAEELRRSLFGVNIPVDVPIILLVSAGCFLLFTGIAVALLNTPKYADFLIETEGEIKKVSWPPQKEYVAASMAVIVVIVFVFCFLWLTDSVLSEIFARLKIGF